jgi:hypothetical protein
MKSLDNRVSNDAPTARIHRCRIDQQRREEHCFALSPLDRSMPLPNEAGPPSRFEPKGEITCDAPVLELISRYAVSIASVCISGLFFRYSLAFSF